MLAPKDVAEGSLVDGEPPRERAPGHVAPQSHLQKEPKLVYLLLAQPFAMGPSLRQRSDQIQSQPSRDVSPVDSPTTARGFEAANLRNIAYLMSGVPGGRTIIPLASVFFCAVAAASLGRTTAAGMTELDELAELEDEVVAPT